MKNIEIHIDSMKNNSSIENYILPGLTSTLITEGKVRLFEASRNPYQKIVPHSHRYDLLCYVITGWVINTIWEIVNVESDPEDDVFITWLQFLTKKGYEFDSVGPCIARPEKQLYEAGQWYHMDSKTIHSIDFGKGAKVLVFEGKEKRKGSEILLPLGIHPNSIMTQDHLRDTK